MTAPEEGATGFALVVDDDPAAGAHIVATLGGHGCRAVSVEDHQLALDMLLAASPAVVILDRFGAGPRTESLLRCLLELGDGAPAFVLLRCEPGLESRLANGAVTVLSETDWFERLPGVVSRYVRPST